MGLTLITEQSVSAVSSVDFDNVFSATYRNYLINISWDPSTSGALRMTMRTGGSTDTGANYDWQEASIYDTSVDLGRTSNTTHFYLGATGANSPIYPGAATVEVSRPFLASYTSYTSHFYRDYGTALFGFFSGRHEVASSQDGMNIASSAGTFTGTIRVYGYEIA